MSGASGPPRVIVLGVPLVVHQPIVKFGDLCLGVGARSDVFGDLADVVMHGCADAGVVGADRTRSQGPHTSCLTPGALLVVALLSGPSCSPVVTIFAQRI